MDAATSATISSVASTVGLVLVAWLSFKTAKLGKAVEEVRHNTNSLKDALVASTAKASHSEGVADGRQQVKAENQLPP